jgi:hypothetical protein
MRGILALVVAALLMVATAAPVAATDENRTKGGGTTDNGWVLRWNASHEGAPTGEVEVIGPDGTRYHGDVTCLVVEDNLAVLAGTLDIGPDEFFVLWVQDTVAGERGADMVEFDSTDNANQADCDIEEPDWALVRGNAQVKDDTTV